MMLLPDEKRSITTNFAVDSKTQLELDKSYIFPVRADSRNLAQVCETKELLRRDQKKSIPFDH